MERTPSARFEARGEVTRGGPCQKVQQPNVSWKWPSIVCMGGVLSRKQGSEIMGRAQLMERTPSARFMRRGEGR